MIRSLIICCIMLTAVLAGAMRSFAQDKPEILLVGVMHHIPDRLKCNWKSTLEKLEKYKPDQLSIEYNLPGDTLSHLHYLGKNYRNTWDSVVLAWEGKKINPADSVIKYASLVSKTGEPRFRLKLWRYLHLNTDMGNRDYQAYLIEQEKDRYIHLLSENNAWDKNFEARQRNFVLQRKDGEFFNLIFPLAGKLNISYLYPSDEKSTYTAQSEAYGRFAATIEKTEDWKKYLAFWQQFNAAISVQMEKCQALEYLNSKNYQEQGDFGQTRILEQLNNPDFKTYTQVWYDRNRSIASRIIDAVNRSKAQKMAVFYGDMHVVPIRKFLEEKGYKVRLLSELN